jgi:hypothetical protein
MRTHEPSVGGSRAERQLVRLGEETERGEGTRARVIEYVEAKRMTGGIRPLEFESWTTSDPDTSLPSPRTRGMLAW